MNQRDEHAILFSPFWPLCVMALSFTVLLAWLVLEARWTRESLVRDDASLDKDAATLDRDGATLRAMQRMQAEQASQAAQAESKLQAIMMDLLKLSATNADALAIVSKYGIKFNPSAATPAAAPPQPRSSSVGRPGTESRGIR